MSKKKNVLLIIALVFLHFSSYTQVESEVPPLSPFYEVYLTDHQINIDGNVDFDQSSQWVPLSNINWVDQTSEVYGYFKLNSNGKGLLISTYIPEADPGKLMPAGRSPETPFIIDVDLDAQLFPDPVGIGNYSLRFTPLVEEVSRMIYRTQPFLMNHRLGSGTEWNDKGIVIWSERTIAGIITENIEARWSREDAYEMEIFIPWENLRVEGLPGGHPVYVNITLSLSGKTPVQWIGDLPLERTTGGKLILNSKGEIDYNKEITSVNPVIQLKSSIHKQSETLKTAVYFPLESLNKNILSNLKYRVKNRFGEVTREAGVKKPDENGFLIQQFNTKDWMDGLYSIELVNSDSKTTLLSRPVLFIDNVLKSKYLPYHYSIKERVEILKNENTEAWMQGHISRTELLLGLSDPLEISTLENFKLSTELLKEADLVLIQLESGQRPVSERENHRDIAGFSAEGQRGNINFIPVEGNRATLKISPDKQYNWNVNPLIYGTFSEPVVYDRPVYGWLYAQLLRNPGFEWGHPTVLQTIESFGERYKELDMGNVEKVLNGDWLPVKLISEEQLAAPWIGTGKGDIKYTMDSSALNTFTCQKVHAGEGSINAGISQILSLPMWRCGKYNFKVSLKSEKIREIKAQLFYEGTMIDETTFTGLSAEWKNFEAEFTTPVKNLEQNTFLLVISSPHSEGSFFIDQARLFPEDTINGFDPQVIEQFRELNTGWTRWPGGNYASAYNWRNGIGPKSERPTLPNPAWPGLNSRAVGTDEYMLFSRLTDQEPLICVNAGTGTPGEAADWVEYCNGSPDTEMGKLRSEFGSQEPYNIKYWNIGNELWGSWQWGHCEAGEYVQRYMDFKNAMKVRDPNIRFIACATGAHTAGRPDWTITLLDRIGKDLDIMDIHTYVSAPAPNNEITEESSIQMMISIPVAYEQALMEFRRECLIRDLGHIKVDVGEYNNNNIPGISEKMQIMTDLLTYAGWLHGFIRQSEYVMGGNATDYSPFDPRAKQFGTLHPRYDLFRIYREEAGNHPVHAEIKTPVWQSPHNYGKDINPIFNIPKVDVVVLEDYSDGSLGIGLINRDLNNEIPLQVEIENFFPQKKAKHYLFGIDLDRDDSKGTVSNLKVAEINVAEKFEISLPPHSVSLIKVYKGE